MARTNNPVSFSGRIGQKTYWIYVSTILAVKIVAVIMVVLEPAWTILRHTDFLMFMLALIIGKRLRDFGYSAFWGWGVLALSSFVIPLFAAIKFGNGEKDFMEAMPASIGLLSFAILVVLVVGVGLKRGDPETNRFGAPESDFRADAQI